MSPARMEAFSDGVIAVVITIMVLDLKVPVGDGLTGLLAVLPAMAVHLLSFLQTAIYWVNHHYMVGAVRKVNHGVLWSNLLFLFCLSLIPFATTWAGSKALSRPSIAIYAGICLLPACSFTLLWNRVRKSNPEAEAIAGWKKLVGSAMLYLMAVPVALWRPAVALMLIGTVAIVWMLPPRYQRDARIFERPQAPPE